MTRDQGRRPIIIDDHEEFEVEAILEHRGEEQDREYLVKWKDYEEPTWEPAENLEHCPRRLRAYHRAMRRRAATSICGDRVKSEPEPSTT